MYDNIMFEEVDMNEENQEESGVNEENGEESGVNEENGEEPGVHELVDCSDALNTFQVLI